MRHKITAFAQAIKVFSALALLSVPAIGSVPTDTLNAYQMKLIGDSLSADGRYTESSEYYTRAYHDYQALAYQSRALRVRLKIGDNSWLSGNYDQAKTVFLQVIEDAKLLHLEKERLIADAYHGLGTVESVLSNYNHALNYFRKSIEINEVAMGELNEWVASTLNNIAVMYWYKGYYDSTEFYLQKVMSIQSKTLKEGDYAFSRTYNNLGNVYLSQGLDYKAIDYINKAVELTISKYNSEHYSLSNKYMSIGSAYGNMHEYDKAIQYYLTGLRLCQNRNEPNEPIEAGLLNFLGNTYTELKNYSKADSLLHQSLQKKKHIFGLEHPEIALMYQDLAFLQTQQENFDSAATYYKMAFPLVNEEVNIKVDILNELGLIYLLQHKYDSAIYEFRKSIDLNTYVDQSANSYLNNKFDIYISPTNFMNSISGMARCYYQEYVFNNGSPSEKLNNADQLFDLCDSLIDQIRKNYLSTQERIEFSKKSHAIYTNATENSIALYNETQDESYAEKAFYFSEKSRANSLLMASLENSSLHFSDIPDSLRGKENNLKIDISNLEEQLTNERLKGAEGDSSKIEELSVKHFNSKREYESLIQTFASHYPKYHELKYHVEKTSLQTIQKELIEENQVILEYVNTDSTLCIFAVSSTGFRIEQVKKDSLFLKTMDSFLTEIRDPREKSFRSFVKSSYDLYNYLVAPVADFIDQKELIIIPDNQLAVLPFEALIISDEAKGRDDFAKLDYLIRYHNICYANSVKHLFHESQRSQNFENMTKRDKILAFAPSFEDLGLDTQAEEVVRYNLIPLEGTLDEVEKISQYFDTETFSGVTATENYFKEKAGEFGIIHIASHAMVNEKDPIQNKIAFAKSHKDSLNDGFLHVFELYNTTLHADMVVLSACNTGNGRATKGEGVFSLAKGFLYAGCKSVVMSLWLLNDWSASGIMKDFYKYLSQGNNKSSALQQAKLDYLSQSSGFEAHPYYWAPFVISGDASPITSNRYDTLFKVLLAIATLVLGYFLMKLLFSRFR